MLHSYELSCTHPRSDQSLAITAPVPQDILEICQTFFGGLASARHTGEDLSIYIKNRELGHVAYNDIFLPSGYLQASVMDLLRWDANWKPSVVNVVSKSSQ
jgi:hypothetical protein